MENVDSWSSTAKIHLKSVEFSNLKQNILNPLSSRTAEDLFLSFKDFYYEQHGKELDLKYPTYKRFVFISLKSSKRKEEEYFIYQILINFFLKQIKLLNCDFKYD